MTDERDEILSQQVDVAVADYLEAAERGAPPEREAFLAQHPEIADALKQFFDDYQLVNHMMVRRHADAPASHVRSTGRIPGSPGPALPLPRWFGNFELLEEIARGGMGVVYKARQKNPDRIVALKMILSGQLASRADVERFSVEAHAAAGLDHPNIVPIFEVGEFDGQHYFTMALVDGESLAQRLLAGPLPVRESAMIIAEVGVAVHYAHRQRVVHRDLKPANILLDADGRVRVTDFGLAKRQSDESGLTCTGQLLGTPNFMSPEQVSGDPASIGPAADVYSLGATLYALLTGRPPFQAASTLATLRQVAERDPVPPRDFDSSIPRDLETIVLKALAKEPAARYRTAEEMAADLRRFLTNRPILARRSTAVERLVRWCRRNPAIAGLATAATVMLLVGTIASTWQAIRATRAERLAGDRLRTEQAARQEAEEARTAAEQSRSAEATQRLIAEANQAEAEKHRKASEESYRKARQAVDKYFTLVSESTLLDVPGSQPLRRDLLEAALDFYEDSVRQRSTDPQVLADLAVTNLRVSQICFSLNRADEAIVAINRALDALARLMSEHPEQLATRQSVGGFWSGMRAAQIEFQMPRNPLAALNTLLRLQKTWEDLVNESPTHAALRSDLAAIDLMIGLVFANSGQLKNGLVHFRKGVALSEGLIADDPSSPAYRANLSVACRSMADLLRHFDNDEALKLARRAVELGDSLVAEDRGSPLHAHELVQSLDVLGANLAYRDIEAALRISRRALELAGKLVDRHPNVSLYRSTGIYTAVHRAELAQLWLNDSEADEVTRTASHAVQRMIAYDPFDRAERQQIADICIRLARKLPTERRCGELIEQLAAKSLELYSELAEQEPASREFPQSIAACHWVLGRACCSAGQLDEAAERFTISADTIVRLRERGGSNLPSLGVYQSGALSELALVRDAQGYREKALLIKEECDSIRAELNGSYPPARDVNDRQHSAELHARHAIMEWYFGDLEGYHRACQAYQKWLGAFNDRNAPFSRRSISFGGPEALADLSPVINGLQRWLDVEGDNAHLLARVGLLRYRQGQLEESRRCLMKAIAEQPASPAEHVDLVLPRASLALVECRLGNAEAAHERLQSVQTILDQRSQSLSWDARIIAAALVREAGEMLNRPTHP